MPYSGDGCLSDAHGELIGRSDLRLVHDLLASRLAIWHLFPWRRVLDEN